MNPYEYSLKSKTPDFSRDNVGKPNPLLTEAIGVYFLNMDTAVEEEVHPNEDGSFTIIINARISQARQMIAYQHALEHIMNDDFEKADADEIEKAM